MIWCRTGRSPGLSQYGLVWGAVSVVIGEGGTDIHCGACGELRSRVLMPCFVLWVGIGPVLWFPADASLALAQSAWGFWVSGSLHCSQLDVMSQMPNGWKWRDPWIFFNWVGYWDQYTSFLCKHPKEPYNSLLMGQLGPMLEYLYYTERQIKLLHKYRNFHVFSCIYTSKSTI